MPESNDLPSSLVTVWPACVMLVQVTFVPTLIVNFGIVRLLRKSADSSNRSDKDEKAVRLAKQMGRFPTGEFLSNISELA